MNLRSRRVERTYPERAADEKKWKDSTPPRTEATVSMPKFTLQLTKQEIEEDFIAMTGHPPKRRPNKRPKHVQKNLDALFPGSQLKEEVTADMYKVNEAPETEKVKGNEKDESL